MGNGGSVGSKGVLVGPGVGVVGREGDGADVGGWVLGGFVAGGAVGAAVAGTVGGAVGATVAGTAGGDVLIGDVAGDGAEVPPGAEAVAAAVGLSVEITTGTDVGEPVPSGRPATSLVKLKPASARATASDGPRRTYRVKEARPLRPAAL